MSVRKPLASLSLDLDDKWSYLKTHGDPQWASLPSYLPLVVPRTLDLLDELGLKITFFVVGTDAEQTRNRDVLRAIVQRGHEIGNHSHRHEPWLHLYEPDDVEEEIARAEAAIERATGISPVGFRGPGFSHSPATLSVLARRGYRYDASTFPTYLGPLARAYYFMSTRLGKRELEQRALLFGSWREGFRPLGTYLWQTDGGPIVEIPVTTCPWLRVPIHLSYVLYLSRFSVAFACFYFQAALSACRVAGVRPSILLHPLDFLGCDDDQDLNFFPAMDLPRARKLRVVETCLRDFSASWDVGTMDRHAQAVLSASSPRRIGCPEPA